MLETIESKMNAALKNTKAVGAIAAALLALGGTAAYAQVAAGPANSPSTNNGTAPATATSTTPAMTPATTPAQNGTSITPTPANSPSTDNGTAPATATSTTPAMTPPVANTTTTPVTSTMTTTNMQSAQLMTSPEYGTVGPDNIPVLTLTPQQDGSIHFIVLANPILNMRDIQRGRAYGLTYSDIGAAYALAKYSDVPMDVVLDRLEDGATFAGLAEAWGVPFQIAYSGRDYRDLIQDYVTAYNATGIKGWKTYNPS
jgi:hypothetical protein